MKLASRWEELQNFEFVRLSSNLHSEDNRTTSEGGGIVLVVCVSGIERSIKHSIEHSIDEA